MYIFYLSLFIVFLIIEGLTTNLVTVWLSLSALLTSVIAYFTPKMYVLHLSLFVILSIILIVLTKPFVKKVKKQKVSTNSDRLIDEIGIVVDDIDDVDFSGCVKVKGQSWSAKSLDGLKIEKNKKVKIHGIEGVKLIVSEIKEEELCNL